MSTDWGRYFYTRKDGVPSGKNAAYIACCIDALLLRDNGMLCCMNFDWFAALQAQREEQQHQPQPQGTE